VKDEITIHRLLALLVIAFVSLGVTYALVTPCFESPDEWSHLSLVRYFGAHRALPPRVMPSRHARTGPDLAWYLEYHDPPLYYAPPLYYSLAALLTSSSWADMDDLPYLLVPSPGWEVGWAPQPNGDPWNKNIYAHRAEETLAQSGTVRAAYLLRLVSLGLGGVTVLCTYALARLLWPDRPALALGAAACVALNPQFIAISAGVTNDNLLNALFSLSLVCALRCMRDGAAWDRWAMLGGLVGLGLLTKQSALLLMPLGLLAVVWQRGAGPFLRRKVLADGGAFLAVALGVGGWWYVRNAILYGDLLGLEPHLAHQVPLAHFGLNEALMTLRSYWAAFGWALILVEPLVYGVVGLVALAAGAGIVVAIRPGGSLPPRGGDRGQGGARESAPRGDHAAGGSLPPRGGDRGNPSRPGRAHRCTDGSLPPRGGDRGGSLWRAPAMTRRGLALLALAFVLNVTTLVRWAIVTGAPYGRLLFPTLAAAGVLSAWGLSQWTRWKAARWGLGVMAGLAFLFAVLVPWRYLRPAYAAPRLPDGMPDTAQPVNLTFQGGVQIAGYEPITEDLEPGEELRLILYWHAPTAPHRCYRVWVQLGPHDPTRRVAEDGVWLGGTLYPSDLWQAGDAVRQVYRLAIPGWAPAPALYWIRIGLVDDTGMRVALADHSSDMVVLGPWRMRDVSISPSPACVADGGECHLGTAIRLLGYDLEQRQEAGEEALQLTLYWRAEQVPPGDYTVYVHLMDTEGCLLGQQDGPPRDGAYPTSWWLPGQTVVDRHTVRLDQPCAGSARLWVGMYDPATLVRLPAYDGTGQRLPEDTIPLAEVTPGELSVQCSSD